MGGVVSKNAFLPPEFNEFPTGFIEGSNPTLHWISTKKHKNCIPAFFFESEEGYKSKKIVP